MTIVPAFSILELLAFWVGRLLAHYGVLHAATGIFAVSIFAAYALLPIVMWFDNA